MGFVTIEHPKIEGSASEVPEELVEHWAERGWRLVDSAAAEPTVTLTRDGDTAVVPASAVDAWRDDGWTDLAPFIAAAEVDARAMADIGPTPPDPSATDDDTENDTDQEADQ